MKGPESGSEAAKLSFRALHIQGGETGAGDLPRCRTLDLRHVTGETPQEHSEGSTGWIPPRIAARTSGAVTFVEAALELLDESGVTGRRRDRIGDMVPTIEQWETSVTDLWGRFDSLDRASGVAAMRELVAACPATDGRAAFELAGMYDSMGFEDEAGAEYERALELGLEEARHAQLAVQYGSTLRNLGRLDEAIAVLQAAPVHASTGSAPRIVLALALHSAGRQDEALQVALDAQIDALPRYQRSMRRYASALTEPTGSGGPAAR